MSDVGQRERQTQNRIVHFFVDKLGYQYYGNWIDRANNRNIEVDKLTAWLMRQGYSETLISRALFDFERATLIGAGKSFYDANKEVYSKLRYGIKVQEEAGQHNQTVYLINWKAPLQNDFAIAEEVSIQGKHNKRPDIVLYINGIAVAVLELKRSTVSVEEGIRQNITNQTSTFIQRFFTTIQLVMAGNDTQGLRYAAIQTPEKYYLNWKEEFPEYNAQIHLKEQKYLPTESPEADHHLLDTALMRLCGKERLIELIHDFIVYDSGTKKLCRHNQYFGVKAAQKRVKQREGGIIWHTQGSGKSLTMVWIAKWIREQVNDARVLIITDRTELDYQIENVFHGVEENIYRTRNGADLIHTLNQHNPWLICSLVHKFGSVNDNATDEFIKELQINIPDDFKAKGEIFVFVDECHRGHSGKLHEAMNKILPNAMFIGFTGTPLLRDDKRKSIEVFGSYIHTYKFDEAVADGVVLDLRYEARNIEQFITSEEKVDEWFDLQTRGLTDMAKVLLKQKWGTMREVLSSKDRLEKIVLDIQKDMMIRPRLADGRGNALLVCSNIYQACKVYEIFQKTPLRGKCAIVTSYKPSPADIRTEETGEGQTEKLHKYEIYKRMLSEYFDEHDEGVINKADAFEKAVKKKFKEEPGQMKLLIVVDKLLTGFDAPSATYLYIDKKMQDHGLFQAICRLNRLDGEDKDYGYIIDYRDLFNSLENAICDYTSGALDGYEPEDVQGLITDRLSSGKERLDEALETVRAICEPVALPRDTRDYLHYFCAQNSMNRDEELKENEPKRVALYKAVASLIRAYANIANEMTQAGYTTTETKQIRADITHYEQARESIKLNSGDYVDMKQYEPAMRQLLDNYVRSNESEVISNFDDMGLVEILVKNGIGALDGLPAGIRNNQDNMAETIENNIRKTIIDGHPINPKYYEKMSELLNAIIEERLKEAIQYSEYLEKIKKLAAQVLNPQHSLHTNYPVSINSAGKQALYDNLEQDENLAVRIHETVMNTKSHNYIGHIFKEREVKNAIENVLGKDNPKLEEIFELIKKQNEYQ